MRRIRHILTPALALAILYGCGGGGGSAVRPGGAPAPPAISAVHLQTIGADQAHAAGAKGAGVTVAVIDSGIRDTHDEFRGISGQSKLDMANAYNVADGNTDVSDAGEAAGAPSHGTRVASLVNGENVGVAPEATILPVRVVKSDGTFTTTEVAAGINYAIGVTTGTAPLASILNLSVSMVNTLDILNAVENAAARDVLLVTPAGNTGANDPEPYLLVQSISPDAYDRFLIVGAVNNNGEIAAFSNRAGTTIARDRYLVAPGVDVNGADARGDDLYSPGTGTSFSAPLVAGAAALVWAADPTLTAAQVADILLATAKDLGDPGTDDVYGRGLLDVAAAMRPVGVLALPTGLTSAEATPVRGSGLFSGGAFGDALQSERLAHVVVLDRYRRPFRADLRGRTLTLDAAPMLPARLQALAPGSRRIAQKAGGFGIGLDLWTPPLTRDAYQAPAKDDRLVGFGLTSTLGPFGTFGVYGGYEPAAALSRSPFSWLGSGLPESFTDVTSGDRIVRLGTTSGAGWGWQIVIARGPSAVGGISDVTVGVLEVARVWERTRLHVRVGKVDEALSVLGAWGTGAFQTSGAASGFLGLTVHHHIGRFDVQAGYETGWVSPRTSTRSLVRRWSRLRASAWYVETYTKGILVPHDAIGLRLSQPLRVERGRFRLDVPIERTLAHTIVYDTEWISAAPTGRERDVELAYSSRFGRDGRIAINLLRRFEPSHRAGSRPETWLFVSLRQSI